jgi:propionyl-CoA carboxylase alpha chain
MLWIGAGWGIPQDMLDAVGDATIVPHCGHAVEARVYAEDPLRGFLPSTGPLVPYMEPTELDDPIDKNDPNAYKRLLRIDSGVAQGHVVTPFYDPLLSKVIVHAGTRADAVEGLAQALDHYVIEGVQHNARLVNAVLRHEAFKKGETPTSFLKRHFPDGFVGVQLDASQKEEFAVAIAAIDLGRRALLQQPPLTGVNGTKGTVVVKLGGLFGEAYAVTLTDNCTSAQVQKLPMAEGEVASTPRTVAFDKMEYDPASYLAHCTLDGKLRAIQVSLPLQKS